MWGEKYFKYIVQIYTKGTYVHKLNHTTRYNIIKMYTTVIYEKMKH